MHSQIFDNICKQVLTMKKLAGLLVLGALSIGFFLPPAQAQSASEDVVDLQTLDCRTLLKAEDDNRASILVFMHGYISGKKGDMSINGDQLSAVTDQVIDACIDQPDAKLLSVFEQYRKE